MLSTGKSDSPLCHNACGFYGNKIWDGFCSKCYRDVYQQAKQMQQVYDGKCNIERSESTSSFQEKEKRRSNLSLRNPIRQIVHRTSHSLRSSTSSLTSLNNEEQLIESEASSKYLDSITTDEVRLDIKNQVKTFSNQFQKKCSNSQVSLEQLVQDYSSFREMMKTRIESNAMYQDEHENLIHRIRDYLENIIFSKNYSLIFDRFSMNYEEADLAIQNRISSLHWITPAMLDATIQENHSDVRESLYKAINALIELDSKQTPQGKIDSIMECKYYIEEAIRSAGTDGKTINADCFLPALIYVVLQAKPPRLHSNIQFLSQFSQPNGEQLYYLANLDSAVRFIELLQAEHLGLSSNDFHLYMRGEPIEISPIISQFNYPNETDEILQQRRKISILHRQLDYHYEKFNENIQEFRQRLSQTVSDLRELMEHSFQRFTLFSHDIPSESNES